MGANSRQRNAAKRRREQARRAGRQRPGRSAGGTTGAAEPDDLAILVYAACRAWADQRASEHYAQRIVAEFDPHAVAAAVDAVARAGAAAAIRSGWTPNDIAQVAARRVGAGVVPVAAHVVRLATDAHPPEKVAAEWTAELAALPGGREPDTRTVRGLVETLRLSGMLTALPPIAQTIPAPGAAARAVAPGRSAESTPALARVRALLAKAESTEFAEEAEALTAKAQELISRHALDRLLAEAEVDTDSAAAPDAVVARRLWIDAPYVDAKGLLISVVADANRCTTVLSPDIGFATVLGDARDLDAVELLVTSLLVQAAAAMLAHGSRWTSDGTSRTRSFRRSFLFAYAGRIGERLAAAATDAAESTGHGAELVPIVAAQRDRVEAARDELFPGLVSRRTSVSDSEGWTAGRVAADLARLDARDAVADSAAS